jgi:hypothetical protein
MHHLAPALLLLAGAVSFAQAPAGPHSKPDASAIVLRSIPVGTNCPIGFRADRQSTAQILSAGDAKESGPALGLRLTLDRGTAPSIESIEVTVYGVTPKGRILPAQFQAGDAPTTATISKSFQLKPTVGNDTLESANVWMHQVGALRWVDLNEIRYADGTTWRPSDSAKCRAVPSNLVLIGQK